MTKQIGCLCLLLTCLAIGSAPPSKKPITAHDNWYVALLDGRPIGWMHAQTVQRDDQIRIQQQTNISLRREQVFDYHMWSQAWIEAQDRERWVYFDAMRNPQWFGMTHITVATNVLVDKFPFNGALKSAPLLGILTIRVSS